MNFSFCIKTVMDAANRCETGSKKNDLWLVQSEIEKQLLKYLNSVDIGTLKEAAEDEGYDLSGFEGFFESVTDFKYGMEQEIVEIEFLDSNETHFWIPVNLFDEE